MTSLKEMRVDLRKQGGMRLAVRHTSVVKSCRTEVLGVTQVMTVTVVGVVDVTVTWDMCVLYTGIDSVTKDVIMYTEVSSRSCRG